jgi:hypothetical protein
MEYEDLGDMPRVLDPDPQRAPYHAPQVRLYVDYRQSMLRSEERKSPFVPRQAPYLLAPPPNFVGLVPLARLRAQMVAQMNTVASPSAAVQHIEVEILGERRDAPAGAPLVAIAPRAAVYAVGPDAQFAIGFDAAGHGPEQLVLALLGLPDGAYVEGRSDPQDAVERLLYRSVRQRAEVFEQDTHWHDRLVVQMQVPADAARAVRAMTPEPAKRRGGGTRDVFVYDERCARVPAWAYAVRYALNVAPYARGTREPEAIKGADRAPRLFPFVVGAHAPSAIVPYLDNTLPISGTDRLQRVAYTGSERPWVRSPHIRFPHAPELGAAQLALNEELTGRASGIGRIVAPAVYQRSLEITTAGFLALTYRAVRVRLHVRYRVDGDGVYDIDALDFPAEFAPFDRTADQTALALRPHRASPLPADGMPVCVAPTPETAYPLGLIDSARAGERGGQPAGHTWRARVIDSAYVLANHHEAGIAGFPLSIFQHFLARILTATPAGAAALVDRSDELLRMLDSTPLRDQRRLVDWNMVRHLVARTESAFGGAMQPDWWERASFARFREDLRYESIAAATLPDAYPEESTPPLMGSWVTGPLPWITLVATPPVAAPPSPPPSPAFEFTPDFNDFSPPSLSGVDWSPREIDFLEPSTPSAGPAGPAPAPAEVDVMELDAPLYPEPLPASPPALPALTPPGSPFLAAPPRTPAGVAVPRVDRAGEALTEAIGDARDAFYLPGTSGHRTTPAMFLVGRAGIWRIGMAHVFDVATQQRVSRALWRLRDLGFVPQSLVDAHERRDERAFGLEVLTRGTDLVLSGSVVDDRLSGAWEEFDAYAAANSMPGARPIVDPVPDIIATLLPAVNAALGEHAQITIAPLERSERTRWVSTWTIVGDYARAVNLTAWTQMKNMLEYHGFSLDAERGELRIVYGAPPESTPAAQRWLNRNGYDYIAGTRHWEYDRSLARVSTDVFLLRMASLTRTVGGGWQSKPVYDVLAQASRARAPPRRQ